MNLTYIDFLVSAVLATIMFGVGLSINFDDLRQIYKSPRALVLGLVSQMILLPLIAFLVVGFTDLSPTVKAGFVILAACILIMLGGLTVSRNRVYQSETALWEDTVRKSPSNARAYNNLGYAYFLKGREAEARSAYLRALEIDPGLEHARNNLDMLGKDAPSVPQGSD